jgi:hypothetical protein
VLFQSDVEALIGKRPFEEKKTLSVEEEAAVPAVDESGVTTEVKKEEERSADGQAGNFGLAPSV